MEFNYAGGNGPAGNWALYIFDYIRAFHLNKPINPATGKRNPTITNHSWGYSYGFLGNIPLSDVTSVTFRGTTTAVTGTDANKKTIFKFHHPRHSKIAPYNPICMYSFHYSKD